MTLALLSTAQHVSDVNTSIFRSLDNKASVIKLINLYSNTFENFKILFVFYRKVTNTI